MYYESEEEKKRKAAAQGQKIAQSQASATPIQATQTPLQAAQMGGGGGGNPLQQIGMQVGKKVLGSMFGGLGGMLGGLFNKGGKVSGYNQGGLVNDPVTGELVPYNVMAQRMQQRRKVAQMKAAQGQPMIRARNHARSGPKMVNGKIVGQVQANRNAGGMIYANPKSVKRNMGGPLGNPYGYNEGGPAGGTPIKKVMDVEKLEAQKSMDKIKENQAERAFQMAEKRKDEAHRQAMQQKAESHRQQMKLKQESATMKGPLSKGE